MTADTTSHCSCGPNCPTCQVPKVPELTYAQLRDCPDGTQLHFTNHPCRPSVPVTVVVHNPEGNIRLPDGSLLCAFPDELTWTPRSGLGA